MRTAAAQLDVTSASTSIVTFTRVSGSVGTLTAVAAGSTNVTVSLFHIGEGDTDFGPFPVAMARELSVPQGEPKSSPHQP